MVKPTRPGIAVYHGIQLKVMRVFCERILSTWL